MSDEGRRAVLSAEGSVAAVVAALVRHADKDVQDRGCFALASLAVSDEGRRAVLAVEGSVAAVVAALVRHADKYVQGLACRALANLALSDEGKRAVLAVEGSIAAMEAAVASCSEALRQHVHIALASLKQSEEGSRAVPTTGTAASSPSHRSPLPLLTPEATAPGPSNASKRPCSPSTDGTAGTKRQRVSNEHLEAELEAERARRRRMEAAVQQQEKDLLMVRYMALRQHIECLRMAARAGPSTWNLKLARGSLVAGVLEHFKKLSMGARLCGPVQLWRNTRVTFEGERGVDEGGLTAEMHAQFWVEVCRPEHVLFEQHDPDEGDGRYLPRPGAPLDQLEAVGRVLLKSIVDDHPTGPQLARYLFLFLRGRCCLEPQGATDAQAHEALQVLADVAPGLARQWREHALEASAEDLGMLMLTLENFDESLGEAEVTRANVASAVVAGCRRVLHEERSEELKALERGFTFNGRVDLALQLAPIPAEQLLLMVRGKDELSADDLLGCFDWPGPDEATAVAAAHLQTVIACRMDHKDRRLLLRWCTARSTLPVDGLKEKVSIELLVPDDAQLSPDQFFPRSHTCYPSIELPAYSSADVLWQQLQVALVDLEQGGGFALE